MTLTAVLDHGHDPGRTVALRAAAVAYGRRAGGYPKLDPVPTMWPATIADIVGGGASVVDRMVEGVLSRWKDTHANTIVGWHRGVTEAR